MRPVIGPVLLGLALVGCSKQKEPGAPIQPSPGVAVSKPKAIEPESLEGTYIGKLTGEESPDESPLPSSIRQVVGDATLTLTADGQRFTMTHKGLNLEGSYKLDGDQLVLQVEQVEGLSQDDLATVDFKANKRAKREPSTPEMLALFREVLLLTDWRFKVSVDGFEQLGEGNNLPSYKFKRKQK